MSKTPVETAGRRGGNGESLAGSATDGRVEVVLGSITAPEPPDASVSDPKDRLLIPWIVIESSERPTAGVGRRLSGKPRIIPDMDATGQEKLSNRRPFKRVNEKRVLEVFRRAGVETVLDVGCGIGNTVAHLVACGFDAHGVTINPAEIEASGIPGRLAVADIQHPLQHPRLPFDAIISFDCLEHLENPSGALRNINAALKTGGQFICYIPPVKWTECDYHVIVYTPRQMKWLLNLTGFRLEGTEGRFRGKGVTYYTVKQSAGQLQPGKMK